MTDLTQKCQKASLKVICLCMGVLCAPIDKAFEHIFNGGSII